MKHEVVTRVGERSRLHARAGFISLATVCGLVLLGLAVSSWVRRSPARTDVNEIPRMSSCQSNLLKNLRPQAFDIALFRSVERQCYEQINAEDTLAELGIRRAAFLQQQEQMPVMLAMVVAITLSGVLLAGLQLAASYRLASTGRDAFEQGGQLSLEGHKISLNSSVTGIVILTISLAFFYVFVSQVYLIRELNGTTANPSTLRQQAPPGAPTSRTPETPTVLNPGGLGTAPQRKNPTTTLPKVRR
jgi:hypothetical protein